MKTDEARVVRVLLTGSFGIVAVALALQNARYMSALAGLGAVGAFFHYLPGYLHRRGMAVEWLLIVAVFNLLIVAPELGFRASGFRYDSGIEFGYPRPHDFVYLEPDEKLFWKRRRSDPGVNSWGFPGGEIEVQKPDGIYRILFLGDSVTQQGFPDYVEHFLNTRHPSMRFESITLAVSGYSSHQGRIIAETRGQLLDPDLVVVYFGWNDHWRAYGAIDSEKVVKTQSSVRRLGGVIYAKMRTLQAALWAVAQLTGSKEEPLEIVRVPPDQYRENLSQIVRVFQEDDVPLMLITAPTAHYRLGVPDYLLEDGFIVSKPWATSIHREYNNIVRITASEANVGLLDLEKEFAWIPEETIQAIFNRDGIGYIRVSQLTNCANKAVS